jgi:cytoskeleton protein RodZ
MVFANSANNFARDSRIRPRLCYSTEDVLMTEAVIGLPSGAGALLREERVRQGLEIDALAAAIKIPPSRLDALESGRYAELPDATFTRALAQTVCRHLKIDALPVLALLPASSEASLDRVDGGLNAPFRERPGRNGESVDGGFLTRRVRWLALGLLVAAAALLIPMRYGEALQSLWHVTAEAIPYAGFNRTSAKQPSAGIEAPSVQTAAGVGASAASATDTVVASASAAQAAPPLDANQILVTTAPALPVTGTALPAVASPIGIAATPAAIAAPPLPAIPGATASMALVSTPSNAIKPVPSLVAATTNAPSVTFKVPVAVDGASVAMASLRAAGVSWVEVRDASGKVLLSRTLKAGDTADVAGPLPLKVTIGNASVTQLSLRGRAIDLGPAIRDNVARVELQ